MIGLLLAVLVASLGGAEVPRADDASSYTKLRFDYAARKDFRLGWEQEDGHKAVIESFKKGAFAETKVLGDAWLTKVPVDTEIYLVVALSRKETGDLRGYCEYMRQFYGMLASITATGDGLTTQTAFKIITVAEEYLLLRDIGAKPKKQTLSGHCDVMVVDQRGKERTYYFDVTSVLAAEKRELGEK